MALSSPQQAFAETVPPARAWSCRLEGVVTPHPPPLRPWSGSWHHCLKSRRLQQLNQAVRSAGRSPRLAVKFIDERLRCDVSVRVSDDRSDLVPIGLAVTDHVEVHAEPIGKHSSRRCRWLEKSVGVGPDHFLLNTRWDRTPQRDSPIFVVVVVEVAQRSPASNKEARFAMADALADPWQLEGDLSYPSVLTHRARLAGPARRRNEPRERRTSPTRIGRSGATEGGLPRSASLRASATERQVSALAIVSGALPTRPARRHRPGVSKRRASWAIVVVTGCLSSWRSISLE